MNVRQTIDLFVDRTTRVRRIIVVVLQHQSRHGGASRHDTRGVRTAASLGVGSLQRGAEITRHQLQRAARLTVGIDLRLAVPPTVRRPIEHLEQHDHQQDRDRSGHEQFDQSKRSGQHHLSR